MRAHRGLDLGLQHEENRLQTSYRVTEDGKLESYISNVTERIIA
jgi:hypothetical protein